MLACLSLSPIPIVIRQSAAGTRAGTLRKLLSGVELGQSRAGLAFQTRRLSTLSSNNWADRSRWRRRAQRPGLHCAYIWSKIRWLFPTEQLVDLLFGCERPTRIHAQFTALAWPVGFHSVYVGGQGLRRHGRHRPAKDIAKRTRIVNMLRVNRRRSRCSRQRVYLVFEDPLQGQHRDDMCPTCDHSRISKRADQVGEDIDADARHRIDELDHELRHSWSNDMIVRDEKRPDHCRSNGARGGRDQIEIRDVVS